MMHVAWCQGVEVKIARPQQMQQHGEVVEVSR